MAPRTPECHPDAALRELGAGRSDPLGSARTIASMIVSALLMIDLGNAEDTLSRIVGRSEPTTKRSIPKGSTPTRSRTADLTVFPSGRNVLFAPREAGRRKAAGPGETRTECFWFGPRFERGSMVWSP
ncbi:hypothetical protein GCM10023196_082040 [Actinoallomurus vinaceus]|uniref:Transposase n=1 Tax=Actinoallomurus vinaceus TaxID=1080074 RepID=A0ABP8UNQ9_9ACTN